MSTHGRSALKLTPNLPESGGFHDEMLQGHEGLGDGESEMLNAWLIPPLCNHIGARANLREALAAAREAGR